MNGGDASGTSGVDNNMGISHTSGMGDGNSTSSMNNTFDSKNPHAKASFNIYNSACINMDVDAGDTTSTRDTGGTGCVDNNTDGKNAYAKGGFSAYNIANANADARASAGDISGTGEKVSNNINNISEG